MTSEATSSKAPLTPAETAKMLRSLAAFIAKKPADRLNMADWTCGSAHCIGGWACFHPAFKKRGLRLASKGYPKTSLGSFGYVAFAEACGITPDEGYYITRACARPGEPAKADGAPTRRAALARLITVAKRYEAKAGGK